MVWRNLSLPVVGAGMSDFSHALADIKDLKASYQLIRAINADFHSPAAHLFDDVCKILR